MRFASQFAVAALLGSLAAPALAGPPRYEVTIVGEGSPLAYRASPHGLSSNGNVTGNLNLASPAVAFRWNGSLAAIEGAPDVSSWGYGVNASGTVVGSIQLGGVSHPFVSRPGEPAQPFAPLGIAEGIAWDINDDGWVVGGIALPGPHQGRAFRWRDGVSEALPMPSWASSAVAGIVTAGGDAYGLASGGEGRLAPVMWTDSGVTQLPSLDGWDFTRPADAVDGLAVGSAVDYRHTAAVPVVWKDGQIRVLPHEPGVPTYTSGVNTAGDIVGFSLAFDSEALLWSDGEMFRLQELLAPGFEGELGLVRAINDRGQILASAWLGGLDGNRAVLLTPIRCYADCDASGSLDFFDFLCFQNAFAAGATFADCDESGELEFFDFLCFQNEFAAGCD